jgi:hypothetical protein
MRNPHPNPHDETTKTLMRFLFTFQMIKDMIVILCNIVCSYTGAILWQVALSQLNIGYGHMVAIPNSKVGSLGILSIGTLIL